MNERISSPRFAGSIPIFEKCGNYSKFIEFRISTYSTN